MNAAQEVDKETHAGKNDCQEFWNAIEGVTGFVLPAYIRNILKFHGFDNAMSVQLIDEEDIRAIENFTKSDEMTRILTSDVKDVHLKDYYGPFVESRPDFQILRGHRKVLMGISAFIREKGTQVVYDNIKRIKNRSNYENVDLQSINNEGPLNSKADFVRDNSLKSNDANFSHVPITETRSAPTPSTTTALDVTDTINRSSVEDVPTNGISFQSITTDGEMAKITVRRNCLLPKSPSNPHPYGKGWPQKSANDNKDFFDTSAQSDLKSLKMDFKFTNSQEWSNSSVKNDVVGFIHRTSDTTTPHDDVTDKMNGFCEDHVPRNGMPFESKIKAVDLPKITVRRKCVLFKSSPRRHPIVKGWPEKGINTKSNGNAIFFDVSTQSDCKLPKMDSIA